MNVDQNMLSSTDSLLESLVEYKFNLNPWLHVFFLFFNRILHNFTLLAFSMSLMSDSCLSIPLLA